MIAVATLGGALPAQAQRLLPMYGPDVYDDGPEFDEPPVVVAPRVIVESPYGPPRYGSPVMPSREVFAILRATGFSPLGVPMRRGPFYVVSAIHPNGEDGRVTINAVTGRFVRFDPAYATRRGLRRGADAIAYGRAVRPPLPMPDIHRPPVGMLPRETAKTSAPAVSPKVASRSAPSMPLAVPKPRPVAAPGTVTAQSPPQAAPQSQPSSSAAKPADAAPAAVATTPAPETKPPEAAATKPEAAMPPVQPLE